MPPRKRTTTDVSAKAQQEAAPAEPKGEDEQPAAANAGSDEPNAGPTAQEGDDASASAEKPKAEEPTPADPKDDESPSRSDLQTVERPCLECMPNGWPEGAFSVGCTHGTWVRKNT
ncbi:hypothetical protein [Streptomyces sp. NPDC004721]